MSRKRNNNRTGERQAPVWPLLVAALLLLLGGAAVFFYPTVSNYLAERSQATVIQSYRATVEESDGTAIAEAWEKAKIYNENLAGDPVHDPFVPGSGYALPGNYLEVLNLNGDAVMGYIEIPKIAVNLPIFHGSDEEVLEKGAGHIEQTFLPIGGEGSHAVITGHRGLPSAELFTRLDEIEIGDLFYVHVLDATLAYQVDQINVVLPTELEKIRPVPGEDLVTLVTCTPYAVNTHRLLVRGHRTDYVPEAYAPSGGGVRVVFRGMDQRMRSLGIRLGLGLLLVIAVFVLLVRRKRRKHEKGKH